MSMTPDKPIEFHIEEKGERIQLVFDRLAEGKTLLASQAGAYRCMGIMEKNLTDDELAELEAARGKSTIEKPDWLLSIQSMLTNVIERMVLAYRWMVGADDGHNPIYNRFKIQSSVDGKNWSPVYGPMEVSLTIKFGLGMQQVNDNLIESLKKTVQSKDEEPLGHELFCEAWALRTQNPRSALLIGIAALETRTKEVISKLVPDASWLMEEIPSPPVWKILRYYIPKLPCRGKVNGKVVMPGAMVKIVQKGTELRNDVTHGKGGVVEADYLENLLRTIRDVLYLLDFYEGRKWAFSNIDYDNKQLIIEETK